jgi:peptidoglycan/LPS O-acetylase OafA/YrhL
MSIRKPSYLAEHLSYLARPGGYPGIDVLRAGAILAVVFFHYRIVGCNFGWIGVDLFFVISGFLIGGLIWDDLQAGCFSFLSFYRNRTLRILPTYYLFVVLTASVNLGFFADTTERLLQSVAMALSFTQTTLPYYWGVGINHAIAPGGSWSMVVEEYFYLVVPLLLLLCHRCLRQRQVLFALGVIVLIAPLIRLYATRQFLPNDANWFFASSIQFHSRFDELLLGVIAAILIRHRPVTRPSLWLGLGGLGVLAFVGFLLVNPSSWLNPTLLTRATIWTPTCLGLSFVAMVMGVSQSIIAPAWVVVVARLSFPLYLGHIWLGVLAKRIGLISLDVGLPPGDHLVGRIVLIALSFLLAYCVSLTLEYPFIRYYKRLPKPMARKVLSSLAPAIAEGKTS